MTKKILWINSIITIISVVALAFVLWGNSEEKIGVEVVATAEDAISIGRVICERAYPGFDYSQYEWKCFYDEHEAVWRIFCSNKELTLGGGLPEVHIKKEDARVTFIGLMA